MTEELANHISDSLQALHLHFLAEAIAKKSLVIKNKDEDGG